MIRTVADIGRIMQERDIPVMSIRGPSEKTNGKWLVSFKANEFRLEWEKGRLRADFIGALESALGVKVEVKVMPSTDLSDVLK